MAQDNFFQLYGEASLTSLSFFWKALWAFILGYIVSSAIQVFVTRERMKQTMGEAKEGSIALATFFGFISSSCSFAALATTKSLFKKGAGFIPSMAFLLASTNLVIELGFIIGIFLGWQFVVGEYLGGILLILLMWVFVRFSYPDALIKKVRRRLQNREGEDSEDSEDIPDWKEKIKSLEGWRQVAKRYFMEWKMVWKDVTVGFTIAGIIAVFVPRSFFQTLFIGAGQNTNPNFMHVLENVIVGPLAAFFTFIGSMGNVPLAAVLHQNGVSFAGIMAFLFSDLVVFPVIRINAKYYGWKFALYVLAIFLAALVSSAIILHYGFSLFGLLPQGTGQSMSEGQRFAIDYTFFLNLFFLAATGVLVWLHWTDKKSQKMKHNHEKSHENHNHKDGNQGILENLLFYLAMISYIWLASGLIVSFFT